MLTGFALGLADFDTHRTGRWRAAQVVAAVCNPLLMLIYPVPEGRA